MLVARVVALMFTVGLMACSADASTDAAGSGGSSGQSGDGDAGGEGGAAAGQAIDPDAGQITGGTGGGSGVEGGCGPVLHEPRCLGEWCWDGPSFVGANLFAIDGTRSATSSWAVGALGTAFHFCGGRWWPVDTGVEDDLYDVFSPTQDFAVAVGEHGTVIVWDGATWQRIDMPTEQTLRAVWGASPTDIWIGAELFADYTLDNLFHFDGSAITETVATGSSVRSIRGRSSNDIYTAGYGGFQARADHYDGTDWSSGAINADPDPGLAEQLAFATEKNRTFATFDGASTRQVFADDQPGWLSVFNTPIRAGGLHLDDAGTPSVVAKVVDGLMPGVVFKPNDDDVWMMTSDRFTVWPEEVWTGAGEAWAVGRGNALLTRGDDGVWSQVPEINAQLGTPVFVGGTAEDNGYLVSEHDVYHRDANGWHSLMRVAATIASASLDRDGNLYIADDQKVRRRYDGSAWHDIAPNDGTGGAIYGFAPDDIWLAEPTLLGSHFDGSTWTDAYEICDFGTDPTRFRQAPDGTVWGVNASGAAAYDPTGATPCAPILRSETDVDVINTNPFVDIAWTENGQLWAITRFGELYRRDGNIFEPFAMPGIDAVPTPTDQPSPFARVTELFALPGNTLRYLLTDGSQATFDSAYALASRLVTLDVGGSTATQSIEELPFSGSLWALDNARSLIAFPGGVIGRGFPHAEDGLPDPQGPSGGSDDDGITTNAVPYEEIFCDAPDVTGQTIVVPCVTSIQLDSSWGRPTPGGSGCNDGWSYTVSLVTSTFSWRKCLDGANPGDPWVQDSGSHKLSEAELSSLVDALKVMTLSSATACAGMDDVPLKTAYITTRTAFSRYTDSHYGCYIEEIFVDHIDEALDLLDSMAH